MAIKYIPEPFRIKAVEPLPVLTRPAREQRIAEASYNLFKLRSADCSIDLLTDSGTGAMSAAQWAAIMRGDEAYAGSASYERLLETARDITGFDFIQPVHQGRAAEKVLFPLLLGTGKVAISNMFFDTTRAHVELAGARCVDCVVEAATQPGLRAPFKGNMDVAQLRKQIAAHGREQVALIVMTVTNNSAGGQPVSLQNLRDVYAAAQEYGIPVCLDAARFAENAWFIQQREAGFANQSIAQIVRQMFDCADFFTMSAKKDGIVNMGGLLGVRDGASSLVQGVRNGCIAYEGFYTYGGLAGRDMEALAIGLRESLEPDYLRYRVGQLEYLASRLDDAGIAYQAPVGGHGVFVDAAAMFPHIPYQEFPGQLLAVELYKEAGIRACDIGSYLLGNDPDTGRQLKSTFEFTRLAIPRRVYTQAHLDACADALVAVRQRAGQLRRGLRITWQPPVLRHFQATLEPIAS